MILYHYTNLNPFFGDDEQAEAARLALGRMEQPPPAFTVLRPEQHASPGVEAGRLAHQ